MLILQRQIIMRKGIEKEGQEQFWHHEMDTVQPNGLNEHEVAFVKY